MDRRRAKEPSREQEGAGCGQGSAKGTWQGLHGSDTGFVFGWGCTVRSRVVPDVSGRTLAAAIAEQAELRRITLWTDSATAYNRLNKHVARHEKVNHSEGEYVKRGAGTNKAELRFTAQAVAGRHPPPRL